MSYVGLFALLICTWFLVHVAALANRASAAVREDDVDAQVPLAARLFSMPLAAFATAWLVDRLGGHVGSILVGGMHALLFALSALSLVRSALRSFAR